MIFYFDTSALVKKYVFEIDSDTVLQLWEKSEGIGISKVAYAECLAAFSRKKRETNFPSKLFQKIVKDFKTDWQSFILIEISHALEKLIDPLCLKYPLRGFDLIHLASAKLLQHSQDQEIGFVCADHRLREAAVSEKFKVFP